MCLSFNSSGGSSTAVSAAVAVTAPAAAAAAAAAAATAQSHVVSTRGCLHQEEQLQTLQQQRCSLK
jgi:hypothetical protein